MILERYIKNEKIKNKLRKAEREKYLSEQDKPSIMEKILEQSKIELAKLKNQSDCNSQEKWINADKAKNAIKADQLIISDTNKKLKNNNRRVIKAPIKLKRKLEDEENNARKIFKINTKDDTESEIDAPVIDKLFVKTELTREETRCIDQNNIKSISKNLKTYDNEKQVTAKIASKMQDLDTKNDGEHREASEPINIEKISIFENNNKTIDSNNSPIIGKRYRIIQDNRKNQIKRVKDRIIKNNRIKLRARENKIYTLITKARNSVSLIRNLLSKK